MSVDDDLEHLFDKLVEVFTLDHAITLALLLQRSVADALDRRRGDAWRVRTNGVLVRVPTDAQIADLFDTLIATFGADVAVKVMSSLDWRATRALDRRVGADWRTRFPLPAPHPRRKS